MTLPSAVSRSNAEPIELRTAGSSSDPIVAENGFNVTLGTVFSSIRRATHGLDGYNVAKLKTQISDRFEVESGRSDVLKKSVPQASREYFWEFKLWEVGRGMMMFGLPDLFEESPHGDAENFEKLYIYISLFLKPEGFRFPIFGNHKQRADRLVRKSFEHLIDVLEIPLSILGGDTPLLWDNKYCSYSVDKRPRDSVLISVLSLHNAPGYRNPLTGAPDPSYWD